MMNKRYHFITGLPRSGSTLLSAILRQNPKFEAGISSPVGHITAAMKSIMSQSAELDTLLSDEQRKEILRNVLFSYYQDRDRPIVFDTNRTWSSRIPELLYLHGDIKLIAMVRDSAWILDSIERVTRRNPVRTSLIGKQNTFLESRLEELMSKNGLVGAALGSLQEGIYSREASRMLLVEYDALCAQPENVLRGIYQFLGEDWYEHDFTDVFFEEEAFDEALRTPGLHRVTGAVEKKDRKTLLSPDQFQRYSAMSSTWRENIPNEVPCILRRQGLHPSKI